MPVPSPDVAAALHRVLDIWVEFARSSISVGDTPHFQAVEGLSVAVSLLERASTDINADDLELYQLVTASPLHTRGVLPALQDLLRTDAHLMATCRSTWGLARALEVVGLDEIAQRLWPGSSVPDAAAFAPLLLQRLFENDYRRGGYFHLFNVAVEVERLERLELPFGWKIVRLAEEDVANLLNEPTHTSHLHSEHCGNAFLVCFSSDTDDSWEWLQHRWHAASYIVRVLKFLKYGTVDVDWAGYYFTPSWVNDVRRWGLTMLGRPRADIQPDRFTIGPGDIARLTRYLNFYIDRLPDIDDMTSSLRVSTSLAGQYYERHHERATREDKLVDLVVAAEALFAPARDELSFRIAQSGALLLGATADERKRVFKLLQRAYRARSQLVHGGSSPFVGKKLAKKFTENDLNELGELVRVAILKLLTLQLRGYRERAPIMEWLDDAALDSERLRALHDESDVERHLAESGFGESTEHP